MTALLQVDDLQTHFPIRGGILNRVRGAVRAVDGVSFDIRKGEVVGLVGESGSGKTTVGRTILRLEEATSGRVRFDGTDLLSLDRARMRPFRKRMQIIFQDPFASLNPRETVGTMLHHALSLHDVGAAADRRDRAAQLMVQVGLSADYLDRFPHEFSGGQRQRIGIARALAVEPEFVVADEPVSALYARPNHPYTQALLSAVPVPVPGRRRSRVILKGDIPSPINPPSGCVFRTRCPRAEAICAQSVPALKPVAAGHLSACHLTT